MPGAVDEARAAYAAREWRRAYESYAAAGELDADDQDRHAICAMLLGRMDDYFALRERSYEDRLARGDLIGAAMAAFWSGMQRVVAGDVAVGGGWLARAGRLVAEDGTDSLPAACLTIAASFEAMSTGDAERALELIDDAIKAGRRLRSDDLVALATHQRGLVLIRTGRTEEGLAALDEAMVEVTAGQASPMITGIVYCGVVDGCWAAYELHRAQQWTAVMSEWCAAQPDLANFTGECKVRRAELKQLHGEWADAETELAGVSPADVDAWAAGMAAYLRGNLDRLQGRFEEAEDAFAEAARLGEDPQPGLALLRLARGSVQAAAAMVRRCLAETQDNGKRVEVLVAAVEILIAADEPEAAADARTQLGELARTCRTPVVDALAAHCSALVEAASGRPDAALPRARDALKHWVKLRVPYQEARTRLVVAEACRDLGDLESADRETTTARELLESLGATPALARLSRSTGLLSTREVEVLRMLTKGLTNRAIAEQLVLSERSVDRHVSNIYAKLGVSSRAAATTYAFEHQLV
ncbi:MAG TPA: response regulator transcription factor [Marmoricola sp.]|nr:response regulator transcription factor [Marmoricola sp.]